MHRTESTQNNRPTKWPQIIPLIESGQDFQFSKTFIESKDISVLVLRTPETTQNIFVMLDVVDINISALYELEMLDDKTSLLKR